MMKARRAGCCRRRYGADEARMLRERREGEGGGGDKQPARHTEAHYAIFKHSVIMNRYMIK